MKELMFEAILENVKSKSPIVHNITNYVTVNDCANIILAIGASPIMADEEKEMIDMAMISSSLNINIGTANEQKAKAMFKAGEKMRELGKPILFDPVGIGASKFRYELSQNIIEKIKPSVIKGNLSEIKTLLMAEQSGCGVDVDEKDVDFTKDVNSFGKRLMKYAKNNDTVVAVTGEKDFVADKDRVYMIENGNAMMKKITGAGCQCASLTSSMIGANVEMIFEATLCGICIMGIAGEIAKKKLKEDEGNSTYRNYVIDAVYNMNIKTLLENMKITRII